MRYVEAMPEAEGRHRTISAAAGEHRSQDDRRNEDGRKQDGAQGCRDTRGRYEATACPGRRDLRACAPRLKAVPNRHIQKNATRDNRERTASIGPRYSTHLNV